MRLIHKNSLRFGILLAAAFAAAGCFLPGKEKKDLSQAVAVVNGDPISSKEVRRELSIRAKKDPSFRVTPEAVEEQVDVLVNRRLLIQEAVRRKITDEERFTQTIQTFWEQTLVRLLMDRLFDDFEKDTIVTDEEARAFYAKLNQKATFQVIVSPTGEEIESIAAQARQGATVDWHRTIGPLRYDEIESEPFEKAFDLPAGEFGVFHEGRAHFLIKVVSKEPDTPPSFDEIRPKIKDLIRDRKGQRAFEEWLGEKRQAAEVKLSLDRFTPKS